MVLIFTGNEQLDKKLNKEIKTLGRNNQNKREFNMFRRNKKTLKFAWEFGAPGGIRTPGLEVRSLALYPAKLQVQLKYLYIIALF